MSRLLFEHLAAAPLYPYYDEYNELSHVISNNVAFRQV